jgi:hypothetical protein
VGNLDSFQLVGELLLQREQAALATLSGLLWALNHYPASKMTPLRRSKRLVFPVRFHNIFLVE